MSLALGPRPASPVPPPQPKGATLLLGPRQDGKVRSDKVRSGVRTPYGRVKRKESVGGCSRQEGRMVGRQNGRRAGRQD
jgi:hypothetical protein